MPFRHSEGGEDSPDRLPSSDQGLLDDPAVIMVVMLRGAWVLEHLDETVHGRVEGLHQSDVEVVDEGDDEPFDRLSGFPLCRGPQDGILAGSRNGPGHLRRLFEPGCRRADQKRGAAHDLVMESWRVSENAVKVVLFQDVGRKPRDIVDRHIDRRGSEVPARGAGKGSGYVQQINEFLPFREGGQGRPQEFRSRRVGLVQENDRPGARQKVVSASQGVGEPRG